jgi:hypothetical protein
MFELDQKVKEHQQIVDSLLNEAYNVSLLVLRFTQVG